jgi:sulfate/thiosulfate transport system ATP-binding protein
MDALVKNVVNYNPAGSLSVVGARRWDRPMQMTIENVVRTFGTMPALHGVSLDIAPGELVALLGPSGSGKTTLLRILAGLDFPTDGRVLFDGENALTLTVQQRNVGLVFQNYALFRHMTVAENIGFGLRVRPWARRPARREIKQRALELLDLVQLSGLEKRYPSQLSGGQRQRVNIARALSTAPKALVADEIVSGLDVSVQAQLLNLLLRIREESDIALLFISHDLAVVRYLCSRVLVMYKGAVVEEGATETVFARPQHPYTKTLLAAVPPDDVAVEWRPSELSQI